MGRWAQWRDRAFADHYWFAADTSAAGTVPAVLPELLRRLDDSGRIADFFDIFNHRRRPSEVFSARRVLSAAVHAAARQPGLRRAVLTEAARLSADDLRRRRLNRRPIHADEFRRAHGTTQVFVAQVEGAG